MKIYNILETKRFLIIRFFFKKLGYLLIDKKNNESYSIFFKYDGAEKISIVGGIFNDLDGGPIFQPKSYFSENGQEFLISLLNPYDIKANIKSDLFRKSSFMYPEKKKEFEELANRISETDNPILMIVKLKD